MRPYGTWVSPISAGQVASSALRLSSVALDNDDIYWLEGRPDEGGRQVVVKRSADGRIIDVTPPGTNVRSRVNEYGGAPYTQSRGVIFYSDFSDHRLYRLASGGAPEPLTPSGDWYYADAAIDPKRARLICVRQEHSQDLHHEETVLVSVALDTSTPSVSVLTSGHDFYAAPRFSPDGSHLSWITWDHPRMPWDGSELWVAEIDDDGKMLRPSIIAGGERESIYQPDWLPDGALCFVSDRSGWWNLYRWADTRVNAICPMAAEFGRPQWALGTSMWALADDSHVVASCGVDGRYRLAMIDLSNGECRTVSAEIEPADTIAATATHAVMVGGSASEHDAVLRVDLETGSVERIRSASTSDVAASAVSVAEAIEFPTANGLTAHMFYYAPRNPLCHAPAAELPPLMVICHGGPTGSATSRFSPEIQYFTTRGFAVADVNYGGSAGFGRAYRERLKGQWGVVDVDDCVNAARHLVDRGIVDPRRLIVRGRSAGGYTTLAALTFHAGVFAAGASYYGVSDLEQLATATHKFESRYLDGLVGPYPESRELYWSRSPSHYVENLSCPVIFFHGLDDRVVPPSQSKAMAEALRAKRIPSALLMFEGEQHGFRRAENIVRCLQAELEFYGQVFGFTPGI